MKKNQTDRLRVEKIRGQGPKEIFGENAQKHDISVNDFSKVVFETLKTDNQLCCKLYQSIQSPLNGLLKRCCQ